MDKYKTVPAQQTDFNAPHVVFYDAHGQIAFGETKENYHKGLRVIRHFANFEQAANFVKQNSTSIFYKGFEIYRDASFFDRIAFRKIGETDFNATRHVDTINEAKTIIDHEETKTT